MKLFAPTPFRYPAITGVDYPYGYQDIASDSLGKALLLAGLLVADDPGDQADGQKAPMGAVSPSVAFATRTMLPSDWNNQLECGSGSAVTLTVDATSIAGVAQNAIVAITQAGAGALTVTGSGLTIRGSTTIAQYGTICLQLKANGEVWAV